jgi:hypothetical protein
LAEAVRARYEGDFNYEPPDKLLRQKVEALFAASPAPPETTVREPSPASDVPPFSIVSTDFITKQKQLRRWENQTAAQNEKSYELFSAICGDYSLAKYAKVDARNLRTSSNDCPLTTARPRNIATKPRNRYRSSTP